MISSLSNDGIHWTPDFGTDSFTIAVNDFDQNITINSQEIPLAGWQLLLSQRQVILDNHLPRVPITQNQVVTMEMREEVLSNVGAQDLDTSSYQVSNLEDIEFNWEEYQLDLDAVFRPGIDTPFLQLHLTFYRWRDQLKTHCIGLRRRQGECSSINTRVCQTHGASRVAGKSCFWSKNRNCTRLCSWKIVSISTNVFVF